jgi:hypothetical protein
LYPGAFSWNSIFSLCSEENQRTTVISVNPIRGLVNYSPSSTTIMGQNDKRLSLFLPKTQVKFPFGKTFSQGILRTGPHRGVNALLPARAARHAFVPNLTPQATAFLQKPLCAIFSFGTPSSLSTLEERLRFHLFPAMGEFLFATGVVPRICLNYSLDQAHYKIFSSWNC